LPYTPAKKALAVVGHGAIAYPIAGNVKHQDGTASTAALVQHLSDGLEDGHEIVFQTPEPKYQLRCFLSKWSTGQVPVVPAPNPGEDLCP
jgi:hypothetical protein